MIERVEPDAYDAALMARLTAAREWARKVRLASPPNIEAIRRANRYVAELEAALMRHRVR